MIRQHMELLDNKRITTKVSNLITEKFVEGTLLRKNTQAIEDDRFNHVVTRSTSRFHTVTPNEVLSLQFHPDGNSLAYSRMDGSLTVWNNISNGQINNHSKKLYVQDASKSDRLVTDISWNVNNTKEFITVSNCNEVLVWNINSNNTKLLNCRALNFGSIKTKINRCSFDPRGNLVILTTKSEFIYLLDASNNFELLFKFKIDNLSESDTIYSIAWGNSGTNLFIGFKSGKLAILEVDQDDMKCLFNLQLHRSSITSIKMDPMGRYFLTGTSDGTCAYWNLKDLTCSKLINELDSITSIDINYLGKILVILLKNQTAHFYNLDDTKLLHSYSLKDFNSDVILKFHPNKSFYIVSGKNDTLDNHIMTSDDELKLWKQEVTKQMLTLKSKNNNHSNVRSNETSRNSSKKPKKFGNSVNKRNDLPKQSRFNN
ncbi:hypothetical protein KAFR_0D03800 [Kazachstania africana CBS 2517]|uniref:Uncharacterized protein n=1 Tax=Kazachstania africana (strain ATCC 22294 / BCRC 22015 / CBS 2517 / CECT 1963 / NBRC 1671 / NRRL Y-8276) TaxID=1071382 RepID=H2AUH8_KAZAF|nr:hypothetical protein KAFR_0D03800 [Kazachstania africana CBS 2517]CCF58028.1 hypothetical protein KAFR_0D03800 [Kazachstania africana CBS 2517]